MKRVLFVDDEQNVLDGLRRMLYPYRNEWHMVFVSSGVEALKSLSESEFDILVTDIRMSPMSGIQLLSEVIAHHPQIVRIVLSGTADQELTLRSVNLAHQYLVKPCDAATLRAVVERAFDLRLLLSNPELKRVISRLQSLPSLPTVYQRLMEALRSPDVSATEIGDIVSQDMAMTAKVLQLVNSAFFGISRKIVNPTEGVVYLGVETVKSLALAVSAFSQLNESIAGFSIDALQRHGLAVGNLARQIARSVGWPLAVAEDAFTGGLLHDIGKLILAVNQPDQYHKVTSKRRTSGHAICDVELELFGTTHADVGAYLVWLWALPDAITETIAMHHRPAGCNTGSPSAVLAVHVADALVNGWTDQEVDWTHVSEAGLIGHIPFWREMLEEMTIVNSARP